MQLLQHFGKALTVGSVGCIRIMASFGTFFITRLSMYQAGGVPIVGINAPHNEFVINVAAAAIHWH